MPRQTFAPSANRSSPQPGLSSSVRKTATVGGDVPTAKKLRHHQGRDVFRAKSNAEKFSRNTRRGRSNSPERNKENKHVPSRDVNRSPSADGGASLKKRRLWSVGKLKNAPRIATDVAVSRLQRWARTIMLHRILKQHGVLVRRITAALEVEKRLQKLRVRVAKRVLLEALYTHALSRHDDSEAKQQRFREHAVTLVNAFIRTLLDLFLSAEKRKIVFRHAVSVLERAWMSCRVYTSLQQFSSLEKIQRLLFRKEEVERRDYLRQRWAFLVGCHQSCYNHPLLMEAGVSVRHLNWHECVVMDGEHMHSVKINSTIGSTSQEETESFHYQESMRHVVGTSSIFHYATTQGMPVTVSHTPSSTRVSWLKESEDKLNTKSAPSVSERRYCSRGADSSFIHGLLCEQGHLDFLTSMGARPCFYELPQESADSVVHVTCTARLQDTKNVLKVVNSRLVWIGGALVREELQSSPLFRSLSMQNKVRERGGRLDQRAAFLLGTDVSAANTRLLHPVSWKGYCKVISAFFCSGAHILAMGRTWAEFFRTFERNERLSDLSSFTNRFFSPPTSKVMFYQRRQNQIILQNGSYAPLQALVGLTTSLPKVNKSLTRTSVAIGDTIAALPRRTSMEISETNLDVKYELERILIREYHRRWRLSQQYEKELLGLVLLIQREQMNVTKSEMSRVWDASGELSTRKSLPLPLPFSSLAVY